MMPHHPIPARAMQNRIAPGRPARVHLDRARRHLLRRHRTHRTHRTRKTRWHYPKNINQTVRAQPPRKRPVLLLPLLQPPKGHLQPWQRHQDRFMVLEKDHLGHVRGSMSASCRANKCLINATPTASLKAAATAHSLQSRAHGQPSRPKLRSRLQQNQVKRTAVPLLLALERRCKRRTTSIGLAGRQRERLLNGNASLVS